MINRSEGPGFAGARNDEGVGTDAVQPRRGIAAFLRRLGAAGPMALMSFALPPIGSILLLGSVTRLAPWLRTHAAGGMLVYAVGATACATVAILPTFACAILAGWAFGFADGFLLAMGCFCVAAVLAYEGSRRATGDRVVSLVREHPKWDAVRTALLAGGFWKSFWIITLLRLPPLSPFAPFNLLLATTRAPRPAYWLGTLVGMIPRTAAAVWASAHASRLDFKHGGERWTFFAGLALTLLAVGVLGYLSRKAVRRATAA